MKTFISVLLLCIMLSCASDTNNGEISLEDEWSVDRNDVTGELNLFPLSLNPEFTSINNIDLPDDELVGVMIFGATVKVYPYVHTFSYELINDEHNGLKYAFSYCPITKSAIAFTRDQIFRASGYLYKDNMTPWDENTESIWSQMLIKGINGPSINEVLNTLPVVETTWKTIKDHYPNAQILVNELTSRSGSSTTRPPDDPDDTNNSGNEPDTGELTYGVINIDESVTLYRYGDFSASKKRELILNSQKYIVYGNASKRIVNAFKVANFEDFQLLDEAEFPLILSDSNGVKYDVLGRGTNGVILAKPNFAYVADWTAWDNFYTHFQFQD